jgi:hypothetical protein
MNRIWRAVFCFEWGRLRILSGKEPAVAFMDHRWAKPLAVLLKEQEQRSLVSIALKVRDLQTGVSGHECRSVMTKMVGSRRSTLKAFESCHSGLRGFAPPADDVEQETIFCSCISQAAIGCESFISSGQHTSSKK